MSLDYLKRGSENILSVLGSEIRTPLQENKIEKEAKITYDLKESETPLLGGENSKEDLNTFLENMKNKNKKMKRIIIMIKDLKLLYYLVIIQL